MTGRRRTQSGLPFVLNGNYWSVAPSNDFKTSFQEGRSFAAAYLKYVRDYPTTSPLLGSIVLHMRESTSQGHIVGFFDVIDQHIRATIQSPDVTMLFQY